MLNDGRLITIQYNNDNTDSAITEAEVSEYKPYITDVVIGDKVTTIGSNCFSGCSQLESIEISSSVTTISSYAFCKCSKITNIVIPNSVTSIGTYAFQGCSKLVSINIPTSITKIDTVVFSGCTNLETVILPNGLKTIGSSGFSYCYKLSNAVLPNGLTTIGSKVFFRCSSISYTTVPNSVTSIGRETFSNCSGINEFIVPPLLKTIETELFMYTSIVHIDVPDTVTTLKFYAFSFMHKLVDATIGVGVSNIPDSTFKNCENLTTVIIKNSSCTLANTNAFNGTKMVGSGVGKIYVPYGYGEDFKARDKWSTYASHIYELNEDGSIPTE